MISQGEGDQLLNYLSLSNSYLGKILRAGLPHLDAGLPGASAVITSGITSASTAVAAINAVVTVPSTRPANAAAAAAPSRLGS